MSTLIYNQGTAFVTVPAAQSVVVWTRNKATILQLGLYPNQPASSSLLGYALSGVTVTFGPFATGAQLQINGGAGDTLYSVGVSPSIGEIVGSEFQAAANVLNATGTITPAMVFGGVLTSTSAAAVTATLATGAVMEAASNLNVGEAFNWSLINTGPSTVTVTASASHTIVGVAAVLTVTSGAFRTVRTAANTFVTYRLS